MNQFFNILIRNPFKAFLHIGINPDLSFHDRKKTEVINILMFISIPLLVYFIVTNSIADRFYLVLLNTFNFLCAVATLILNGYRKYVAGRIIISVGFLVSFTLQAIFYRSGAEYFIIANLIATLILYNEKKVIYIMAIINCVAILMIQYFKATGFIYDTVPAAKVLFNTAIGLGTAALTLLYFLFEESHYAKEIEDSNEELTILNKTKEKLFSIIAHDLRSPVALLKGSLGLVTHDSISKDDFIKMTDQISKQIDYMQSNLEELLQWSQSQMSGIIANPTTVSLRDVTEEVIKLIRGQSDAKQIELVDLIDDKTIWIDPAHLKIILRNIISNAIKFSYAGGKIEISDITQNGFVEIHIKDDGIGMTQEEIDQIFSENIHSTKGTAQERGTGLGLKLCKDFLKKSGSELHVKSEKGKGSTFIISIPRKAILL